MPEKLKGHPKRCLLELDFESWTPSLDASTWPETVYHLEYRRADGSLAERIVKTEPFAGNGWHQFYDESRLVLQDRLAGRKHSDSNAGTQQLRKQWSLDEETSIIEKSLVPHRRRCELQANYTILDEATQQLEKMLSGIGDTKIIASKILSRLDFVEITLLSCTIVVGEPFLDRQKSENWTKQERRAFRRKYNHAVRLSWILDDILGRWEQLLKVRQHIECCAKLMWTDISSSFTRWIYGGPRRVVTWFGRQAIMMAPIWNCWQNSSIAINIVFVRRQG
ncbi:hypothetical protein BKA61DRAFT_622464 [Leptodontidium sp. MPI-SDFR-AT-0119]|nr:hypothetical protein BKA61DRAFT_622464 [Leptodontidium sp. MPI-SDFR-AT-0119]